MAAGEMTPMNILHSKKIYYCVAAVFLSILFAKNITANGGDQRIVEGRYFINLSRAPYTPRAEEKTSFLASFVDLANNKLVAEDMSVTVRIAKLDGIGTNRRVVLFEQRDIPIKGGILELPYTFSHSGLHEIFFDFTLTSQPQKLYQAPDFLVDVQEARNSTAANQMIAFFAVAAGVLGFVAGLFFGKRRKN